MKQILKHLTLTLSRSKPGGLLTWFVLRHFPFLIPFKKLYKDQYLIAIPHPVPAYPVHILILPRIYLPNFQALHLQSESGKELIHSIFLIIGMFLHNEYPADYQLVINGGKYQEVSLLHLHWIKHNFSTDLPDTLQEEYNQEGLSSLFEQAGEILQNTQFTAYRLIFHFQLSKIQLQLQTIC